jgi:hypothetical protein
MQKVPNPKLLIPKGTKSRKRRRSTRWPRPCSKDVCSSFLAFSIEFPCYHRVMSQDHAVEEYPDFAVPGQANRKRVRRPENWKRAKEKAARYSTPPSPKLRCSHDESTFCKVSYLTEAEVAEFASQFSKCGSAEERRCFVMRNIQVGQPTRRRPSQGAHSGAQHAKQSCYYIPSSTEPKRVCKETFMGVLGIGRKLVADRAFGRVEKALRKVETITSPERYDEELSRVGTLRKLHEEVPLFDWHEATKAATKTVKEFKITEAKKISVGRDGLVWTSPFYTAFRPTCTHRLLKKGMKMDNVLGKLHVLPAVSRVSKAKEKDVRELLGKMGEGLTPFYEACFTMPNQSSDGSESE